MFTRIAHKFVVVTHINRMCVRVWKPINCHLIGLNEPALLYRNIPRSQMIELTIERHHFYSCTWKCMYEFHGKQYFTEVTATHFQFRSFSLHPVDYEMTYILYQISICSSLAILSYSHWRTPEGIGDFEWVSLNKSKKIERKEKQIANFQKFFLFIS